MFSASRPVDRGFCRMEIILTSFRPVKCEFGRMKKRMARVSHPL